MTLNYNEQREARRKALRLLEHMDRTEKGLQERLIQGGFSEAAAEDAVAYVKDYGYVNDYRYALNYILYRIHSKSRQKILQELLQKGISRDVASEAWEEASDLEEPDETSLLRTAIEKKCSPGDTLDDKAMRRLYGYLQRRGFRMGDITAVLDEMGISREW